MNDPIVPTKIIDNFLTDEEVEIIKAELSENPESRNVIKTEGMTERVATENIFFDNDNFTLEKSAKIIKSKMIEHFGAELHIATCDVLNAYDPYKIHTDGVYGEYGIDERNYGAYTCVLPLDDYDSHTIIFDQSYEKTKAIWDWINETDAKVIDSIDDQAYQKYFSHERREVMRYVSVETVFPWKKGSLLVASRYKFHTSDNFIANGIMFKRGIIMWTTLPR